MWMSPPAEITHLNVWLRGDLNLDSDLKFGCDPSSRSGDMGPDVFHIWPCCDLDIDQSTFEILPLYLYLQLHHQPKFGETPSIGLCGYRANMKYAQRNVRMHARTEALTEEQPENIMPPPILLEDGGIKIYYTVFVNTVYDNTVIMILCYFILPLSCSLCCM